MATAMRTRTRAEVVSAGRAAVRVFGERDLMTWSGALAFQVATAIVPFLLFGLALLGFLSLENVWTDVAKDLKPHMSGPAFQVLDSTVTKVLTEKQLFWLTAGFGLALYEMSGGIRVIMSGLAKIYESNDARPWKKRMGVSLLLALAVSALVILAMACVWLAPLAYGDVGQPIGALLAMLRWVISGALLALAVGLTVRYAPDADQPAGWVSVGTGIVVGAWLVMSAIFGVYIRFIAEYGSVYGNLASIVILFAYLYASSIVFFAGAQVDAIIRERVEGNPQGH